MFTKGLVLCCLIATAFGASAQTVPWESACEEDVCLFRRTMEADNGNAILFEVLVNTQDGSSSIVATLPVGVALQPGIRLATATTSWDMTFKTCLNDGCRATRILDADAMATLMTAKDLTVTFFAFPSDEAVAVNIPLAGLVAAISNRP